MVALLFRYIFAFRIFSEVWLLTEGGPARSTEVVAVYLYQEAFSYNAFGSAAATAWIMVAALAAACERLHAPTAQEGRPPCALDGSAIGRERQFAVAALLVLVVVPDHVHHHVVAEARAGNLRCPAEPMFSRRPSTITPRYGTAGACSFDGLLNSTDRHRRARPRLPLAPVPARASSIRAIRGRFLDGQCPVPHHRSSDPADRRHAAAFPDRQLPLGSTTPTSC